MPYLKKSEYLCLIEQREIDEKIIANQEKVISLQKSIISDLEKMGDAYEAHLLRDRSAAEAISRKLEWELKHPFKSLFCKFQETKA